MRQRFALPTVGLLNVMALMVVHGHVDLLLNDLLLDDRDVHVLHHGYGDVFHDGHFLNHRDFLDDRHVDRIRHLGDVVVVDGVDLVGHVDGHVFAVE